MHCTEPRLYLCVGEVRTVGGIHHPITPTVPHLLSFSDRISSEVGLTGA